MEFPPRPPFEPEATAVPPAAQAARDAAARELLPVLLHRVNNSTQALLGVDLLLKGGGTPVVGGELSHASDEVHEIGWLFGVLAAGLGADTLVERVERGGLAAVLRWATLAVRRGGRELALEGANGLQLAAPTRTAPRLAFALALLCVRAAALRAERETVRVSIARGPHGWRIALDSPLDDGAALWLAGFAGTELQRDGAHAVWSLPGDWLARPGA